MKQFVIILSVFFFTSCVFAQMNDGAGFTNNDDGRFADKTYNTSSKEKDFTFSFNPYFWATAMSGIIGLPNTTEYKFNKSFSDAAKDLNMAAMFAGRIKYKSVSLLYDVSYVNLSPTININPANSGGYVSGSSKFKELLSDVVLAYRIPIREENIQIDVFGGARISSTDKTLSLTSNTGIISTEQKSNVWADPILGAFANIDFNKNWFTYLNADFGGFGAGSEYTTSFMLGVGYRFHEHWNTSLGFKSLYTDYSNESVVWNVWQNGLLLSVGYSL